jgi:hypothetical protein
VIDTTPIDVSYHPDAKAMVSLLAPKATALTTSAPYGYGSSFPSWRSINRYADRDDPFFWEADTWPSPSRSRSTSADDQEDPDVLLGTIAMALDELQNQLNPEVVRKLDELNWQIHDLISDRTAPGLALIES